MVEEEHPLLDLRETGMQSDRPRAFNLECPTDSAGYCPAQDTTSGPISKVGGDENGPISMPVPPFLKQFRNFWSQRTFGLGFY